MAKNLRDAATATSRRQILKHCNYSPDDGDHEVSTQDEADSAAGVDEANIHDKPGSAKEWL